MYLETYSMEELMELIEEKGYCSVEAIEILKVKLSRLILSCCFQKFVPVFPYNFNMFRVIKVYDFNQLMQNIIR